MSFAPVAAALSGAEVSTTTQEAPPAGATLVSPIGVTSSSNPTFTWNAVSEATHYYLWVNDSTGKRFDRWYERSLVGCASGTGTCAMALEVPLSLGTITWWIQTWNVTGGYGPWSPAGMYTLQALGTPTLIGPSGYTARPAVEFRWNAVPGATHHYLRVIDGSGTTRVQTWYELAPTNCASGTACSITLSPTLSEGTATWSVQAWNATAGYSPWSAGMPFTPVDPLPTPTTMAPSGSYTGMPSVQFQWTAVPGATEHYLWVTDGSGTVRVQTWYGLAATNCASGGTCSMTLTPALSPGTATWWIRARNDQIMSAWSPGRLFTPNVPLSTPTAIAPSGTYTALPSVSFSWHAVPGATLHQLWVTDGSGTIRVQTWYDLAATTCASGGTCSLTLTPTLSAGTASWWIQARNQTVTSAWSTTMQFTPIVTPPTLSVPAGTYPSEQTVVVSSPYAGAVMRYTTTIVAPTESDPVVPVNGQILVDRTLTLCARTWLAGQAPSAVTCGSYVLRAQAPVLTPGAGTYASAQSVTMSSATPGAAIRYTTDGSEPSESSTLSSGLVTVDASGTVKAAAFKSGWSASATTTAAYVFDFGTLAPPSISPSPGTYVHGQQITITGPDGAMVRYTTDGTSPTATSPEYTAPLTMSSSMTVSARAFQTDWAPSAIATAIFEAQVAAPLFSVQGGTYAAEQVVTVTTPTPDAVIRFTTNGQDPTEGDALVPGNGQIPVDRSLTLRARAWASGEVPSDGTMASYILQAMAPTINPGSGTYASEQAVTVQSGTSHTILRYTLDGSAPSEASPVYTAPLTVAASRTVTAQAFRTNWTASTATAAVLTFAYGTLDTPLATPEGGAYGDVQTVTLTAPMGADIRYTLDGSEPTGASALYADPIAVGEGTTTLKARAFKSDWTPSVVLEETYIVELPALSITAQVWPKPNAAGWNKTDVSVSFYCSGAVSCPEPVTVTQEGVGHIVSGTAVNAAGTEATTTVTLRIDKTPPTVSNMVPASGTIYDDTWSVPVSATVSDALSGVASVTCNGISAEGVADIACVLTLRPGHNSAVVSAVDVAGNTSSMGRRLFAASTITSIRVLPATRTMLLSERELVEAVDQSGRVVPNVTWTSSDQAILTIDAGTLTPVAAGQTQITAEYEGVTASASVTVLSGATRAHGAVRWTAASGGGQFFGPVLYANRVDPSIPDLFSVAYDAVSGLPQAVHGFSDKGTLTRVDVPPIDGNFQLGPDRFGGLLAWSPTGVTRFGGRSDVAPWHYASPEASISHIAQGPDATVFFTEESTDDTSVVILDGETGAVRARVPLAPGHLSIRYSSDSVHCVPNPPFDAAVPVTLSGIAVSADGVARLTVVRSFTFYHRTCVIDLVENPNSQTSTVEMLQVRPDGAVSVHSLQT